MSLSISNTFVSHTLARSAEINQNFTDIQTAFNNSVAGGAYTAPTAWSPIQTGYSSNPTFTYARYTQVGKFVTASWQGLANGTHENASSTVTMTLPVAPLYAQTFVFLVNFYSASYQWSAGTVAAGSTTMTIGQIALGGSSLTATLPNNYGANLVLGWGTASNCITYEVA